MKKFSLYTHHKKILADTITPVSIYLKIRDKFPNSILLESSDYHANDNSFSYICCNPIASIKIENDIISQTFPDGSTKTNSTDTTNVVQEIHKFTKRFKVNNDKAFKFINNGIFGFTAYDAVKYFEDIKVLIVDGLRKAANLTTFTEADDVLVEHVIDAIGNKEYQDDVLDVIEDATENSVLKPIVHGATAFFRELFNIPDNDE